MGEPLPTDSNGRDEKGKFAAGNKFAKGNPYARRMADLKNELLSVVDAKDVKDVIAALIAKAKDGDVPAAKLFLSYAVGAPQSYEDSDKEPPPEFDDPELLRQIPSEKIIQLIKDRG